MRKIFDHEHSVTISAESIIFATFFLLGLYFLYFVRDIVIIFFLAVILMSALHPAVKFLVRRFRFPKILAILTLYLGIILVFVFAFSVILPPLLADVPNLISSLNLPPLPTNIRSYQFTLPEASALLNQIRSSFGEVFSLLTSTFSGIVAFLTILVMALYMLLDHDNLYKKATWVTKDEKQISLIKEYIDRAERQLGDWVRGQLFLMFSIGLIIFIGLTLFSVPFALPLALASAFFEILPNLGPTLSAIPAIVVAYTTMGPAMAGIVTVFYIIIHQLENHFIVPKIMKESVDVSPLTTILTILIGLKIGGVLGALLAVPFYILLRTGYSLYLREKETSTS